MKKIFLITILHLSFTSHIFANELPIIEYQSINHPVIGDEGMVVSQRMIASEVGASIPVSYTHLTLPTTPYV